MKVIIAGTRDILDYELVLRAIENSGFDITEIVSGKARGVDSLGEIYAALNDLPVKEFPADWNKFGKSAGFIRNKQMADYAEALIAVWDRESAGTKNMIDTMFKLKKPLYVEYTRCDITRWMT